VRLTRTRRLAFAVLCGLACAQGVSAQDPAVLAASASGGAITLGPGPTEVNLVAAGGPGVASRLQSVRPGQQIYLTFSGAQAPMATGTTYNVYLGLPKNAAPQDTQDRHYAGTINFFNAAGRPIDLSLNITPHVGRLLESSEIGDSLRVTIVPIGEAAAPSPPQIGGVRLTSR
jgi:hypothetical protein